LPNNYDARVVVHYYRMRALRCFVVGATTALDLSEPNVLRVILLITLSFVGAFIDLSV
jgi:hypothetical protein